MKDLPIACSLPVADLRTRREAMLSGLAARATARAEIARGVRFRFDASNETLSTIARTIDAERKCCAFLRFALTVEEGRGPMILDVTGPEGTQDFLRDLLIEKEEQRK